MLLCYARELKDGFAEYVDQVSELMIPLLKFYFHDGVRSAAAESLPYLLECSRQKGPEHVAMLWRTICDKLLEALKAEPENEIQSELITAFSKSVELLGDGCLDDVMMASTLETMEYLFEQHFKRQTERLEKRNDEDYDEGVEEMLQVIITLALSTTITNSCSFFLRSARRFDLVDCLTHLATEYFLKSILSFIQLF